MILKILTAFLFSTTCLFGQNDELHKTKIKNIFSQVLAVGKSYDWLDHLTNQIGGRLSGSLNAERAIKWAKEELDSLPLDSVWLQAVMVPKWVRGTFEYANIESSPGNTINVNICALGGSISTPSIGVRANVVEVRGIDDLSKLGKEKIKGKIVFFNRPMDEQKVNALEAYAAAVDQSYSGAAEAAKYGAVAMIVRSMNFRMDDYPHTDVMSYGDLPTNKRIPAAAISTNDAQLLSSMIALNPKLRFFIKQNCFFSMCDALKFKYYYLIGEPNTYDFHTSDLKVTAKIAYIEKQMTPFFQQAMCNLKQDHLPISALLAYSLESPQLPLLGLLALDWPQIQQSSTGLLWWMHLYEESSRHLVMTQRGC